MPSTFTWLVQILFQRLEAAPKSYTLSRLGTKSESMPATICIVSLASSPIVMLPPIVTLPVTSKLPVMLTLSNKSILLFAALRVMPSLKLSTVFPLMRKFPVSILSPLINVLLAPVVNVAPSVKSIFNALATKFTVPAS